MDPSLIKVLLVEDNEDDYVITRELLADVATPQFELEWVSTYETAVEVIARQQHDVYLLDYRLGSHTGLDLLQHALNIGCDAPIILITGSPSSSRNIDLEAMQLGAADFLSKKEINPKLLERSLRYAIRQRQLYQQVKHQAEREQALNRVVQTMRNSLDLSTVFSTATFEITQLLRSNRATILQYHPEHRIWHNVSDYPVKLADACGLKIPDEEAGITASLRRLEMVCIEDASQSTDATCQDLCQLFAGAWLLVPLTFGSQLWGSLWLVRDGHLFAWHEWEIELVHAVADQLAIAIQQSQLHQQVQQLNIELEHQVQTRTAELQNATAKLQLAFETVQSQVEELEHLNQIKDDFLSTVTHELRTPMASIKLAIKMLEIILQQAGMLNETTTQVNRYIQILREQCKRETDLINDLLDLSRLDAENDDLKLTTQKLQLWLPGIIHAFVERTLNQQQHLNVEIPADLPALTTDFAILERILTELLHNACKYTPPQEQIVVTAQSMTNTFQINVSNSGTTIPASELPRLFDKFYRVPNCDPWKHGGTGLGLALVKQRIERLQGTIAVTSEQGWTTFTLAFPCQTS